MPLSKVFTICRRFNLRLLLLPLLALSLAGCATLDLPMVGPDRTLRAAAQKPGQLRMELIRSERRLHVYVGRDRVATYPVAVGKPGHPTRTGSYRISSVDWNPDWSPPKSDWARGQTYKRPGEPGNPMGRARIKYDPPYTIHGTRDNRSLGRAASHGSVRVSNAVALSLARLVMEKGGASRSESWYRIAIDNPTRMRTVNIPRPIPLTIRP